MSFSAMVEVGDAYSAQEYKREGYRPRSLNALEKRLITGRLQDIDERWVTCTCLRFAVWEECSSCCRGVV